MQSNAPSRALVTAVVTFELLAFAFWAGGLTALGAIVAPTVFGVVPMPTSADAMTLVFRRFDRVAMACAAVALVAESALAARGGRARTIDVVRGAVVVLAASLAIGEAVWLSPAIEALHRGGAVRGLGPAGLALERTHKLAEAAGKGQLLLLLAAFVLAVRRVARPGAPPSADPRPRTE
jgi:hypothetical protein